MNKHFLLRALGRATLATTLAFSAFADGKGDLDAIWNDPVFKKQFIGGYGINAEIEPRVTPEEVTILEKIRPLMAADLPKAEEALKKQLKPDCSAILDFTLGGIQFQQDKLTEALENYRKAVTKFPAFRRAWRNLGLINVRKSEYDAAISSFIRMIELGGGDAYSYGLLGFAYSSKQDYQPAEAAYRNALMLQPENTEWRLGLTRCAYKQDKFEECAALLDVLITRFPDKADFWLLQAHTYLGMKKPLLAAQNLEAVDSFGKSTVDSLYLLGDIYLNENLLDLSMRAYLRAIDFSVREYLRATDVELKQSFARPLRCAELLVAHGANGQAQALAARIHQVWDDKLEDSDRHRLLKLEARVSMSKGGGTPETAAILEEIVKLDPLDGDALMMLGGHYSRQNEPDRAIFYYERAASLEAFEVNAKVRHAQLLVGLGRYSDALPLLRRAQEVKPRDDIARYLEQVERIAKARR